MAIIDKHISEAWDEQEKEGTVIAEDVEAALRDYERDLKKAFVEVKDEILMGMEEATGNRSQAVKNGVRANALTCIMLIYEALFDDEILEEKDFG